MKNESKLEFVVNENTKLLEFLYKNINNKSKNNIKSLLSRGNVYVKGKIIKQFDHALIKGDKITIQLSKINDNENNIDIIYEDKDFIVINKPYNLLSVSTLKEKEETAYRLVSDYYKKNNSRNKIFVVHRLDKDTSGVMLFSKSEKMKNLLQNSWENLVETRNYIAIVEGKLKSKKATIKNYLKEDKNTFVYVTKSKNDAKEAITEYEVLNEGENYSLVNLNLKTGRKNQIRVHMQYIGNPVTGDKKYGAKTNKIKRLALHANILEIKHPITNKVMRFEAKVPANFNIK